MFNVVFDPVSNRADWIGTLQLRNAETSEPITDLTGVDILIELRDRQRCKALSGTFDNGKVTDQGNGVMRWQFPVTDMQQLCPSSYDIGITIKRDGITVQELVGSVPVIDGVVRR